ncbi:sulfatase-like hydrolase/transferase [Carboxylicivirga mesophila]|uniref:Sulfatase-like hydrolase/transferase n=1 Tax=Carboxylicivirga mesophila TaxID=1166478 RepID=A0ABS5KDJ1_9BACT|nr:sulfatase-like hydrolase/transferase [Carboxylicivirga mesophila]MBS2213095.1 sulfatase-like hydrolase/transferase [Carboxylicivirga mesophila]
MNLLRNTVLMMIGATLSLLGACSHGTSNSHNKQQPNVLFIITDDQGYGDFSAYGGASDAHTPHLDELAQKGIRFTNAYVSMSVCSPSRMAMLTGRQQQRWGVYNFGAQLPESEITLAEQLKEQGYQTGMVGKSHYGPVKGPGVPEFPTSHGFDYYFGKEGGTMDYLRHKAGDREGFTEKMANHLGIGPFWENDKQVDMEGYSTDIILDKSLQYIEEHKHHPFFLMVSFNAVHLFTHQIPDEDLKLMGIDKVPDWDPATGDWDEYLEWYVNTVKPHTPQGRQRYLYHLNKLDDAIGTITAKLKDEGLDENTIVVFISDNGGSPRTYADNTPLKGNKYILEEGGIRVPFVLSWPGHLPQGKVFNQTVSGMDIFPTLHAALDMPLPANTAMDGVNLMPYLLGKDDSNPHEWLFWTGFHLKGKPRTYDDPNSALARHDKTYYGDETGWAVRYQNWKLRYYGRADSYGLFDLTNDYSEEYNLAADHPELVEQMKQRFFEWNEKIKEDHVKYDLPESSEF